MIDYAPMLAQSIDPKVLSTYISTPAWYLEQKMDGERRVIEVNDGEVLSYNRRGEQKHLDVVFVHAFVGFSGHWVFDCELVNGVLWVFDMPEALDKINHDTPYKLRRETLETIYSNVWPHPGGHPRVQLVDVARTAKEKRLLVARVLESNGEGVMAKLRTAPYLPSTTAQSQRSPRRSPNMLKVKFTETCDCIIGVVGREGKMSCSLFMYDEDSSLQEIGSVKMTELNLYKAKMGDVVEIRYLYVHSATDMRLYQPTFIRFREDKAPHECTTDQLKITNKTVLRKVPR